MSQPVLICRPGERGEALAAALRERGESVESLNVMQLEALPETPEMRRIWLDIDQYHKIIVISPFAATCLSEALDRFWPQLPIGIDYYSVGSATAATLYDQLGVRVHVPAPSAGEDTSEALLALASLLLRFQLQIRVVPAPLPCYSTLSFAIAWMSSQLRRPR